MKKKYIPLVLALSCMLAACGGENGASSNVQNSTPISSVAAEKHTVTYAESADYTVTGLVEGGYAEGETVSFKITVNNAAKEVDDVVVNRQALTPAADGTYSFTMGDSNVTINITLKDKANAKTATIEVSNATPEAGDTITVTLKLDGTALTSGVTVTATKGADLVEITGTSVKCKTAGEVTLKAEATVEGIPYSKTIDVTIKAAQTAADRHALFVANNGDKNADVTIQGKVVHKVKYADSKNANIAIQEGEFGYWINNAPATLNVGDYIKLTAKGAGKAYPALNAANSAAPATIAAVAADALVLGASTNDFAKSRYSYIALPAGAEGVVTEVTKDASKGVTAVTFTYGGATYKVNYNNGVEGGPAIAAKLAGIDVGAKITALKGIWGSTAVADSDVISICSPDEITWTKAAATSVVINGADSVQMGSTLTLTADVVPAGADQAVTWSVAEGGTGAATIDQNGVLTPSALGTVIVEATATGTSVKGTKTITIEAAPSVPVDSITVTAADNKTGAKIGEDLQLSASVLPANAAQNVTWSSSDEEVATVDPATGLVTFVGDGHVVITASATDESGKTGTIALDTQFDNLITLAELDAKMAEVTVGSDHKGTLKENGVDAVYTVRGYVVGINGQNTMISDGVSGFTIYQNKTAVEVGDKVTVTSTWQKYYSTTQTGTISSLIKTKVAMDPITEYTVRTGAELVAMSSNSTDNLAGKTFKAENAVIKQEGTYKNLYVGGTKVNTTIVGLNDIELPLDVYGTFTGFIYQANSSKSVLTIWVTGFTANGEAAPTALTISGSDEVEVGLSTTLTVSGVADNFMNADTSVTWGVANKDTGVTEPLATIDQNGVLTAGSTTGVVTVTATSTLAPTVTATFDVTIKAAAALTTHTISFGNNGNAESSTAVDSYTTSWDAVADGVTYTIENMNRNTKNGGWDDYIRAGRKNTASVASVSTVAPFAKKIGTVTVNLSAVTAANFNSFKLYVASDAAFANVLEEVSLTPAKNDNVFTVATPTANCYYKVEFDMKGGSGNGFVSLHSIAFAEVA